MGAADDVRRERLREAERSEEFRRQLRSLREFSAQLRDAGVLSHEKIRMPLIRRLDAYVPRQAGGEP